jgi:hypothetical protein
VVPVDEHLVVACGHASCNLDELAELPGWKKRDSNQDFKMQHRSRGPASLRHSVLLHR